MADTPEGKVKAKLLKLYAAAGAWYDRAAQNAMGRNGRPDDLVCRSDGHFGGIEAKADGIWRVSDLQRIELNKIMAAGGSGIVCNLRNLYMVERWLGCNVVIHVVFGEPGTPKRNTVRHHLVLQPGREPIVIKNPGDKPGNTSQRA